MQLELGILRLQGTVLPEAEFQKFFECIGTALNAAVMITSHKANIDRCTYFRQVWLDFFREAHGG